MSVAPPAGSVAGDLVRAHCRGAERFTCVHKAAAQRPLDLR